MRIEQTATTIQPKADRSTKEIRTMRAKPDGGGKADGNERRMGGQKTTKYKVLKINRKPNKVGSTSAACFGHVSVQVLKINELQGVF